MISMKTRLFAGLMIMGLLTSVKADETKTKPAAVEAAAVSLVATVDSIDYKTRTLTLKGEDGGLVTMDVGPEVVRFNEIKKGDKLSIDYLASVAVVVQSPDKTIASAEGSNTAIIRNKGKKPSGVKVQTDVVTATVDKVNAKKRVVTLIGPQGNKFDVDVAPDVANLENVKKGDQLLVQITRSLALAINSPTK